MVSHPTLSASCNPGEAPPPPSSTDRFCWPPRIWSTHGMQAFKLTDLHDCWEMLKAHERVAADAIPLPVQDALKELGLVEVNGTDVVLLEDGRTS